MTSKITNSKFLGLLLIISLSLPCLVVAPSMGADTDVFEKFNKTYQAYEHCGAMGDRDATFKFKTNDGKTLCGTFDPDSSTGIIDTPMLEGTIDGDSFSFVVKWKTHIIRYDGTINDEGFLEATNTFLEDPDNIRTTQVSSAHQVEPEGGWPQSEGSGPGGGPGGPGGSAPPEKP